MANLVGVNHLPYVQEQIEIRQGILGKSTRDSKDQTWANGRTSYIKLVSSVNIEDQEIYILPLSGSQNNDALLLKTTNSGSEFRQQFLGLTTEDYSGNKLSKQLMLMGGTLNQPNSGDNPDSIRYPLKSSVSNNSNVTPSSQFSYGLGGTEFGLKAMPGITSFNSKTYNDGSLREATITVVANNKKQFEYLESIYLRLGYTMLLEWGNTSYPTSILPTEYSSTYDASSLSLTNEFLKGGTESFFYTRIEENRKESKGNYDAFLGRVKNFSWEFTTEGTYNITLNLISIGSVIESLKIAIPTERISNSPKPEGEDETSNSPTVKSTDKEYDNALTTIIETLSTPQDYSNVIDKVYVNFFTGNIQNTAWFQSRSLDNVEYEPVKRDINGKAYACFAIFGKSKFVKYLRFKDFLDQINANLLIYNEDGNPVYFSIDVSEDLYCYSNGYSISSDPSKMIIKFDKTVAGIPVKIFAGNGTVGDGEDKKDVDFNIENFHEELNGAQVGNIMNLYFSTDYLIQEVNSNTDSENNLSVNTLITKLLTTASNLLGGVNKFKTRLVDKPINGVIKQVYEMYDEVQPYNKDKILGDLKSNSVFKIYGVNEQTNLGSFVTDYSLKTEISKNLETMIAIGAQANGTGVGVDSTMFSKWNIGLVDRIIPNKLSKDNLEDQKSDILKAAKNPYIKFARIQKTYLETLSLFSEFSPNIKYKTPKAEDESSSPETFYTGYGFDNVYLTSTEGQINFTKFIQIQKEYFNRALAIDAILKRAVTPIVGFLPISLNLTFDGLSGIRIFDKLEVNSEVLPNNYGETLEFIITELDHFIEGNKWFTRVGTLSIPKLSKNSTEQAKINIEEIFESTLAFTPEDETDQGIVGTESYNNSTLGNLMITTYSNGQKRPEDLNKRGTFYLPNVGTKNTAQKAGAGKFSPLVSIGKLGGKFKYPVTRSNVSLSEQDSEDSLIYRDQYDSNYYLARPAAENLSRLIDQAKRDGISFEITSAYRNTYHNMEIGGDTNSAHAYGGAIDIGELYNALNPKGSKALAANATVRNSNSLYKWLEKNAPKYGWYNPYRLRDNGGISEVWHWEFWGIPSTKISINAVGDSVATIPSLEESPNLSILKEE